MRAFPVKKSPTSEDEGLVQRHSAIPSRFGVLASSAALRSQIMPGEADPVTDTAHEDGDSLAPSTRARLSWAQLLKRVFAIDLTTCPQCGEALTLLAAIEDPAVIFKILSHLGLPTRAPPRAPAQLDAFLQTA